MHVTQPVPSSAWQRSLTCFHFKRHRKHLIPFKVDKSFYFVYDDICSCDFFKLNDNYWQYQYIVMPLVIIPLFDLNKPTTHFGVTTHQSIRIDFLWVTNEYVQSSGYSQPSLQVASSLCNRLLSNSRFSLSSTFLARFPCAQHFLSPMPDCKTFLFVTISLALRPSSLDKLPGVSIVHGSLLFKEI